MNESKIDRILKLQQKHDPPRTAIEAVTRASEKLRAINRASTLLHNTAIDRVLRANDAFNFKHWNGYQLLSNSMYTSNALSFSHTASLGALFNTLKKWQTARPAYLQFYLGENEEGQEVEESVIVKEATRIKTLIKEIYNDNERIYTVAPREFEELVAELLYAKGFTVDLTQQTRDGGYDILAVQETGGFPVKFLVECKRHSWKHPVGVGIIRSFMDVIQTENANAGLIVTTSYFTKDASARQQLAPNTLFLNDKHALLEWVKHYRHTNFR